MDAALGHRVVHQVLAAQQSRDRAAIHDGAAMGHVRHRSFRHVKVAVEVGLQRLVEMLVRQFVERVDMLLKRSVVDEDVEAAEPLQGLLNGARAELRIGDVAADQQAFTSLLLDSIHSALGVLLLFQVDDCNVGAFSRIQHGHAAPDPTVTAGDDRNLALELFRAEIMRRVVKRIGIEFVFVPGLGLMLLRKGQFGIAPRARLHRLFVVRRFAFHAIAVVNFGLNAALLGDRARGRLSHDLLPLVSAKATRDGRSRRIRP